MSRTFTIARPSTNMEPTTAMETALLPLVEDIKLPEPVQQPLTIALTEILGDPNRSVATSVLNSFVSSLNLMLVNRVRMTLEDKSTTVGQRDASSEKSSLDQRNEADDAAGQNAGCYHQGSIDEANAAYAGNPLPLSHAETARALACIRSYCHLRQESMRSNNVVPFEPRSLNESIDWLRTQQLPDVKPSDLVVRVAVAATRGLKTADQVAADRNLELKQERDTFEELAPQMVEMGDMLTNGFVPDEQEVEQQFDRLPPVVKINVYTAACNALVTSYNNAYKQLMRRGDVSRAADMTLASMMHERALRTLHGLCKRHSHDLNEFADRGGALKDLRTIV